MSQREIILEKLESKSKERHAKHYEWLRTVVVTASGLVGIIISFKSGKSSTCLEFSWFVISIALFAIGIMAGTIALYGDTNTDTRMQKQLEDALVAEHKGQAKRELNIIASPNRFYYICERICYVTLLMAVCSLIVYAAISDRVGLVK